MTRPVHLAASWQGRLDALETEVYRTRRERRRRGTADQPRENTAAPIADVWASVTEPDRTRPMVRNVERRRRRGRMIKVQMGFEPQAPWLDKRIDACDPPRRLALSNESGNMRIELLLSHSEGETELWLVHHLDPTDEIGAYGPGWEYYLDMLVAVRGDLPTPRLADYYPAMKRYYEALATQTDPA